MDTIGNITYEIHFKPYEKGMKPWAPVWTLA